MSTKDACNEARDQFNWFTKADDIAPFHCMSKPIRSILVLFKNIFNFKKRQKQLNSLSSRKKSEILKYKIVIKIKSGRIKIKLFRKFQFKLIHLIYV